MSQKERCGGVHPRNLRAALCCLLWGFPYSCEMERGMALQGLFQHMVWKY